MPKSIRKAAIVIIEGRTEEIAIKSQIEEYISEELGYPLVLFCKFDDQYEDEGGDITSKEGVTPENIDMKISQYLICPRIKRAPINEEDIACVIQITDADGVFIPDCNVHQVRTLPVGCSLQYEEDQITTLNQHNILLRNKRKADNLRALYNKETLDIYRYTQYQMESNENYIYKFPKEMLPDIPIVNTVPYHIFFFSCNLDHFINRRLIHSSSEKIRQAYRFSEQNPTLNRFKSFICSDPDTLNNQKYKESWESITQGNESLHRHTNIQLLFDQIEIPPANLKA